MEFSTVILRFRDLVTPESSTIQAHNEIIQEAGYAWWAWWKKGNEETPLREFSELEDIAKNRGLDIYLMDSGLKKLYRARCEDIKSSKQAKFSSPEYEKTPSYYNEQEYFAWFKFSRIEEINCEDIKRFSYVNVDSIFEKSGDDYSRFENKIVYSLDELIQQERTVWFVRPANEDDLDNEIVLLKPDQIQPSNFSKKYFQSYGNTILWLSDLHLANTDFEVEKEASNVTLTEHISQAVKNDENIAGLIITGDITDRASKEGFEKALKLVSDLKSEYQINSENTIICPGNHDFKFKPSLKNDKKPTKLSKKYAQSYKKFYQNVYQTNPNDYYCCGRRILLSNGKCVEIVALNSLYLQQYDNFRGQGFISQEQLDFVEEQMGWKKPKENVVRIVTMHHHYLPTCYTEVIDLSERSSVVYDADRLMTWLIKHDVDILLHGHKHKKFFAQVSYPIDKTADKIASSNTKNLSVIAMGGTSCKCDENVVSSIKFYSNKINIKFYRIFANGSAEDYLCQEIEIEV